MGKALGGCGIKPSWFRLQPDKYTSIQPSSVQCWGSRQWRWLHPPLVVGDVEPYRCRSAFWSSHSSGATGELKGEPLSAKNMASVFQMVGCDLQGGREHELPALSQFFFFPGVRGVHTL